MKAIVFQGQSQYDVLNTGTQFLAQEMNKAGIETITCNMNIVDTSEYLELTTEFKPDFTLGANPVCYFFGELTHHEYTGIPHIVLLGDHPYHHIGNRALIRPNASTVFTIGPQAYYNRAFKQLGVTRYQINNHTPSKEHFYTSFENKIFPTVFFGSISDPYKLVDSLKEQSHELFQITNEFIMEITDRVSNSGKLLCDSIEVYFEKFLSEKNIVEEQIVRISKAIFPYIDMFYRNFIRIITLQEFAENGVELWIFTNGNVNEYFEKYPNVKIKPAVSYIDCINIIAQSKVSLNVTPMFNLSHERISNTLFNSTLLCSNEMSELVQRNPQIQKTSLFYNLDTIGEVTEKIKEISQNKVLYTQLVEAGKQLAENKFSYEKDIQGIVNIVKNEFV